MTLYYVYKVTNPDHVANAYVSDPELFARTDFNPSRMEFSGISIEASDPHAADAIHKAPHTGNIFACEEPKPTALLGLIQSKLNNAIEKANIAYAKATLATLSLDAATRFQELNTLLSEMARQLRKSTNEHSDLTAEDIFYRLKEHYIEQFRDLSYRNRPDIGGSPSGAKFG